jgi:hypothetical protein
MGEDVKKSAWFFFTSFRRKPESSVFRAFQIDWTPVFTGVTALIQSFHTFGEGEGGGKRDRLRIPSGEIPSESFKGGTGP